MHGVRGATFFFLVQKETGQLYTAFFFSTSGVSFHFSPLFLSFGLEVYEHIIDRSGSCVARISIAMTIKTLDYYLTFSATRMRVFYVPSP